ncbi:MAG TPA: condensation domain-containing protein [Gemmatimonadales bacterium]|nr:condensation domain-containing protein [Gemmatimonadales bacterium]
MSAEPADTAATANSRRARLDAYLKARSTPAGPRREAPIPVRGDRGPAPLSFGQEGIWRKAQSVSSRTLYNETITIHRHGPLQVAALQRGLDEIVRRHEAWRTTFHGRDGDVVQRVEPWVPVPIPVHDLRGLPEEKRLPEALRLAAEDARLPFDLTRGPLFRPRLVHLDDQEHKLFMAVHQILLDGVSVYRVLMPELAALYDAYAAGLPSPLPQLPIQVSDFAAWQRRWLSGEVLAQQLAYWEGQLAAPPEPLRWPADRSRPSEQTYGGAIHPFALPPELGAGLRALAGREGVTLFVTFLAAFTRLLHRYTGQTDLVIGTPSPAGRKRSEVQGLLGYFLNPVALRMDLSRGPTFRQLLAQGRQVVAEAVGHDDVPFERLVDRSCGAGDPSRHPLFTVAISQEPPLPDLGPAWDLTPMDVTSGGARWDLYLVLDDRKERGILGRVQYNPDIFEAQAIERFLADYRRVLEDAVGHPDSVG